LGTAVIFITHDLGVVASFCKEVNVMYAGRIVESAPTEEIFARPMHPYNAALQQSIPALHKKGEILFTIPGMPPDLTIDFAGCSFAPRCAHATDPCWENTPSLKEMTPGHRTACTRFQQGEIANVRIKDVVAAIV
jgi:oligopeptide/dipeptide ABC transporter ATP-binding protein